MGVKRVKMCPFLEKINIMGCKFAYIHEITLGNQMLHECNKSNTKWPNLDVFRSQNGGQKGQSVPISRKNQYYGL